MYPKSCRASLLSGWVWALDRYGFPSGHGPHAVAFTIMACSQSRVLGVVLVLVPFTVLVALSRVIPGLHFPTDVVIGAIIGATLANVGLSLV